MRSNNGQNRTGPISLVIQEIGVRGVSKGNDQVSTEQGNWTKDCVTGVVLVVVVVQVREKLILLCNCHEY